MKKTASTQSLVRNVLKSHARALRKSEIRDLIGYSGANGYAKVNNAVQDLLKVGEIERTGYGRYQWLGKPAGEKYCKSQNRMWRFMWIRTKKNEPFTVRKIHEMTGVAQDTAKKYVTFLLKDGHLENVGKKRAFKTRAPLYLIAADKISTDVPVLRRQREAAQIENLLEEVRTLAGKFFRVADTKIETIRGLLDTAWQMTVALKNCEQVALDSENKTE